MLSVQHLTKRHKGRTVINDLSFEVSKGENICLFAQSGAGKSTLIQILSGVDRRYKGTYTIQTDRIAFIFQEAGLFWYKTVEENIFYPLKLQKRALDDQLWKDYREWLEVTGLSGFEKYYPYEISGGMKQKAAIIRAMLTTPELILLDEPFNSIDLRSKNSIISHLQAKYPDITSLLITHNPDEISLISDTVLVFSNQQLSTYETVLNEPKLAAGGSEQLQAANTVQ